MMQTGMAGVHLITALIVILLAVIVVGLIRHPPRRKPYIGGGAMENDDEYADWKRRQFSDGQTSEAKR